MSKINYTMADGKVLALEVKSDFAVQYAEMEHKDSLIERKETRRHQSLDKSLEHGFDIPDEKANVEECVERKEDMSRLYIAIAQLQPQQQELIRRVYFNGEKMSDIAREECVDDGSIRHRMQRVVKMLKKLLE